MRLASLTAPEFAALPRGGTLLLPVAALAPRGPHLPLSTAPLIAERLCRDIAEHLCRREGRPPVAVAPPLPFAPAPRSADIPGAFVPSPGAFAPLLSALLGQAFAAGFARAMVVAWDPDPEFTRAAREACAAHPPGRAFEPGSVFLHRGVPAAEAALAELGLDPACEGPGGAGETSLMLHLDERAVRPLFAGLPPRRIDLRARALAGARTLGAMGAADGYIGTPSAAAARVGKKIFKAWRDLHQEALLAVEAGGAPPELPMLARLSLDLG